MSHHAASSSATTPFRRQEQGGRSVRGNGGHGLPYPLGRLTGLPLVMCPDCGLARVIELRVVQDTPNKGRYFFKCPRNGEPKLCGFYRFQNEYLDQLIGLNVVVFKPQQLGPQQLGEDEEASVDCVDDEQRKDLDKKLANLTSKMNCVLVGLVVVVVLVIFVIVMVVRSIGKA